MQFVVADRQRRGDAEDAAHAGQLDDVHVQSALEAGGSHLGAQRIRGCARGLVGHEFDALQQPAAADVADHLDVVAQPDQSLAQMISEFGGTLDEPLSFDDVEHREGDGRGERVGCMRGVEEESPLGTTVFDLRARHDGRDG